MFQFEVEQVLEPEFLTEMIRLFKAYEIPNFIKAQNYYEVKTEILSRTMTGGKPNNRLAHGFCRYITNMATSYFAGKPIRYQIEDEAYKEALYGLFDKNYMNSLNFEVSKEASKKGIGFLLLFLNEVGELRIKKLDAETVIPVYSPSLDEFLEAVVRIWSVYDLKGALLCEYADVYDRTSIHHFERPMGAGLYQLRQKDPVELHLFSDIPVIVVWNNEERMGDFEPIVSLADAYDKAQSDTANDMEYFTDAYLCIRGANEILATGLEGGEDTDEESRQAVQNFRRNKILLLDEDGQAQWLVKNVNDAATENYKNRLYKDIFFLAQVPALSDESFAGNLSGIAIKYKLIGVEELALMKENCFRSAQTKLIRMLTDYLNTLMNKDWDPDEVEQKYERNFIDNVSDTINDVRNLEGIVSKQTQMDMLPASIVDDTAEEMQRIREETLEAEELPLANVPGAEPETQEVTPDGEAE